MLTIYSIFKAYLAIEATRQILSLTSSGSELATTHEKPSRPDAPQDVSRFTILRWSVCSECDG